MDQQQQPRWWTRVLWKKVLWGLGVAATVAAAVAFLIIAICSYVFGWMWTGLPKKTLWDWLSLLIVPVVLAIGVYLLNRAGNQATQAAAESRVQDEALQAYFDHIGQLLLDKDRPLRQSKGGDDVRTLARARTLTVLARLDGGRKGSVLQFLNESRLLGMANTEEKRIVSLFGADLTGANLSSADLVGADLRGANLSQADLSSAYLAAVDLTRANLIRANLSRADLRGANLSVSDLIEAHLGGSRLLNANLSRANLRGANLSNARLNGADLSRANLIRANLSGANLSDSEMFGPDLRDSEPDPDLDQSGSHLPGADLSGADLSRADLSGADLGNVRGWSDGQLTAAWSLKGATMPNGQKYEDWLKDKEGSKEDGENE